MINLRHLREQYAKGVNIMAYLREQLGVQANTPEIVLCSYDLQAGSYVEGFDTVPETAPGKVYRQEVAKRLSKFPAQTVLEAGVGEATTQIYTTREFPKETRFYGFDLAWSRLAVAREFLKTKNVANATFATGDLFSIPLPDNSIDLVYTSHSIEPNGGKEKEALSELYRVARRWLVLFEPSNELGSAETKSRIETYGYCRNLAAQARELGLKVTEHGLLDHSARADNETAMLVIEKPEPNAPASAPEWACPQCKTPLEQIKGHAYCSECLMVYPRLDFIPCLLASNGIVATRFADTPAELVAGVAR